MNAFSSSSGTTSFFGSMPFAARRFTNSTFAGWSSGLHSVHCARSVSFEPHWISLSMKKPMHQGSCASRPCAASAAVQAAVKDGSNGSRNLNQEPQLAAIVRESTSTRSA